MNLTVTNVVVFMVGGILLYAGIKDIDPRDVVRTALGQPAQHAKAPAAAPATPGSSGGAAGATPGAGAGAGGSGSGSWSSYNSNGQVIANV